jgi:hypothetical protein
MFTWILAQWEEYHTSVMKYGNQYYGVLECNYTLALVHVITFVLGPGFWRSPATDYLPIPALQGWSEWTLLQQQQRDGSAETASWC